MISLQDSPDAPACTKSHIVTARMGVLSKFIRETLYNGSIGESESSSQEKGWHTTQTDPEITAPTMSPHRLEYSDPR